MRRCWTRPKAACRLSVGHGQAVASSATRKLLESALSERLGRTVALEPYTDRQLLGGAVLRLGDAVFDGSLRSGLTRLGQQLRRGPAAQG